METAGHRANVLGTRTFGVLEKRSKKEGLAHNQPRSPQGPPQLRKEPLL